MIFNSEIQIVNSTPNRGSVGGKRVRITGTAGKLYASPNKAYKFSKWVDLAGQTISTTNPLVINSWTSQIIEAIFDHIIIDTQFYKDRDALGMQTWHHEMLGVYQPENILPEYAVDGHGGPEGRGPTDTRAYYSQGQHTGWVTTRTGPDNVVWNTYEKDWGYSYDLSQTPQIGGGTYDGTTVTGTYYRHPHNSNFAPASGIPAISFIWDPQDKEARPYWISSPHRVNYGQNDGAYASYNMPFFGVRNSPSVGESTEFPLLDLSPIASYVIHQTIYPLDTTGMENVDQLRRIVNTYSGHYTDSAESIYNLDGLSNAYRLREFNYGYQNWPKAAMSMPYDETIPTPRGMEAAGYWPHLSKFEICTAIYGYSNKGGPSDTLTNTNSSGNWVTEYQVTPKSGSVLYNLRYTKLGHLLLSKTAVFDWSVFSRYGKSVKFIEVKNTLDCATTFSEAAAPFQAHQFPPGGLKGLKNLRALYIYEPYHDATPSGTDWSGLRELTNLKHIHIQSTTRLVNHMTYSDIPPTAEYVYISPSPLATTNNEFPGEQVTVFFTGGDTGPQNVSRYNFNVTNTGVTKEDIT